MRIIDADKLPEHKFTRESAKSSDYMRGWNDCIDTIIDNVPPIETTIENLISTLSVEELKATTWFKVDTPSGEAISFRREKTGHWEYVTHYCRRYRVCSECHAEKEDDGASGWNFCQYCGANMGEKKMDKSQTTIDLINNIKENHKTVIEECKNDVQALNVYISEQNVLLMDIACSLALIADRFNQGGKE